MKAFKLSGIFLIVVFFTIFTACEDKTTTIGSAIASGEVEITVDTFYFNLNANPVKIESFDSKTGNLMIGSIQNKQYGSLSSSFVTRLMCAAKLEVEDSLLIPERVDSCKLIMGAQRNGIVGDSLAPQSLAVYRLTKQLPSDIDNNFDPNGYYDDSSPLGSKNYTVSGIATSDSSFYSTNYVELSVNLPLEFGKSIFEQYKNSPETFEWPQNMSKDFLPGLYVKPTFGNGCIANIYTLYTAVFYHSLKDNTVIENGDTIIRQEHVRHIVYPFSVSPEVLSSNSITYIPSDLVVEKNETSDGEVVITTPGGYIATYEFPAQPLIERYYEKNVHLSTVNDLNLYLPAEPFDNTGGIEAAPNLLMILSSKFEEFFEDNKVPDNKTSFTGVYDAANGRYYFGGLRNYFLDLLDKESISPEDLIFSFVPVEITTETSSSYYVESTTYVTKCVPYTAKPTMTLLKTDEAMVTFSFSTQMID